MFRIAELLQLLGMEMDCNIKIVRHQDARYDMDELQQKNVFEFYQSVQKKAVFECDWIVSFTGLPNSNALFYGVYKVGDKKRAAEVPLPPGFPYSRDPEWVDRDCWYYQLKREQGFGDIERRVVIAWGSNPLAWHQWLCRTGKGVVDEGNKPVVEIRPPGYVRDFPGYLDVILHYDQLVKIIENPDTYRDWHTHLSAVGGVYLITDTATGFQYVGSAYGEKGILGRWSDYAKDPTGGNKALRDLLKDDQRRAQRLQFSIMEILDKTLADTEVIRREFQLKDKLGSRAEPLDRYPG